MSDLSKRDTIIEAATHLMIQQGIDKTSLADIAKALNISRGTLYYYYSAKSDLIFDVATHHINQLTDQLSIWFEEVGKSIPHDALVQTILETILGADLRGKLHLYLVQEAISSDPSLLSRFQEQYAAWKNLLTAHLAAIVNTDADTLAALLIAILDGCIIQTALGVHSIPPAEAARLYARLLD